MANGHGGNRTGAGRRKNPLSEKLVDGNPGKAPLKKLQFGLVETDMHGEDMPPVSEWMKQVTKNAQQNNAAEIYEETWKWLQERGCEKYVNKDLIEQYALYMQRTIQCQEGINQYGLLAKHPTTQMPIASPYVSMALSFSKQANVFWMQIYQIVKDNCETPIGSTPNDDLMERLLG